MASYYYSIPRLEGTGNLRIEGKEFNDVSVSAWFDHEFFFAYIAFRRSILWLWRGLGVGLVFNTV